MKLASNTRSELVSLHLGGIGLRAAQRHSGRSRATISKLYLDVGEDCIRFLDARLRNLANVHQIQADEAWTFVAVKERHLEPGDPKEWGDTWIYFAVDVASRAIVWWSVGKRDPATTAHFIANLRARIPGRVHITTDGYEPYYNPILLAYDTGEVDYVQLVKKYDPACLPNGRKVADLFLRAERTVRIGNSNGKASTSFVERVWQTFRATLGKCARRSNRFSRSLRHLSADVALFVAYYNFVRSHESLGNCVPAQGLGLVHRPLSIAELIEYAEREPEPVPVRIPDWVREFDKVLPGLATPPDPSPFVRPGETPPVVPVIPRQVRPPSRRDRRRAAAREHRRQKEAAAQQRQNAPEQSNAPAAEPVPTSGAAMSLETPQPPPALGIEAAGTPALSPHWRSQRRGRRDRVVNIRAPLASIEIWKQAARAAGRTQNEWVALALQLDCPVPSEEQS